MSCEYINLLNFKRSGHRNVPHDRQDFNQANRLFNDHLTKILHAMVQNRVSILYSFSDSL